MKKLSIILIAALIAASHMVFAGGPLYTFNGKSVVYKTVPIHYRVDQGPLGAFTAAEATAMADSAFKTWENVPTSLVSFVKDGALSTDINGTNFTLYTSVTDFVMDGISPIIFDSDGAITDSIFGEGANQEVIGFAGSAYYDTGTDAGYFIEGESVMNGLFTSRTYDPTHWVFTLDEFKSTFVHEFGHFIGLDHTQIGSEFVNDASKTQYIPTMFPTSTADDVQLGTLNPDDIAAISQLYPVATFASSTGILSGAITRANGTVVRGANIVVIDTTAPLMNVYSTVSDYFMETTGAYALPGLPAGAYWVRVEPIDQDFTGGSGVGPYSYDLTDISFVNPITLEYYNGANESKDPNVDNPTEKTPVVVTAGATTSGINIIGNGTASGSGVLLAEDFTSAAGTALTSAGWTISGTSTVQPLQVTAPGLTFAGYPGSGTGNGLVIRTTGQDVFKSFTTVTSGAVYLSFMLKVDSAKTGDYFIALSPSTGQTNYFARFHVKSSGAGYLLGISKYSELAGGNKYGTTVLTLGTTYAVVVKYEFLGASTTDDPINIFVFPSTLPTSEPATAEIAAYTNSTKTDATDLGYVTLRQGSSTSAPHLTIDGIRIASGWPFVATGVEEQPVALPSAIVLEQNFPNPFNPSTSIAYGVAQSGMVTLAVYDVLGREVGRLVNEVKSAGMHQVTFNANALPSGTYFYTLRANGEVQTKKLVLMK